MCRNAIIVGVACEQVLIHFVSYICLLCLGCYVAPRRLLSLYRPSI